MMRRLDTLRAVALALLIGPFVLSAAAQTETEEMNRRTALRVVQQVINQGKLGLSNELITPDFVFYDAGTPYDLEGWKTLITTLRAAMPDMTFTPELIMSDGDMVAMRYTIRGTHTGNLQLPDGTVLPPSNTAIELDAITINRYDQENRWIEGWNESDFLTGLEQIQAGATAQVAPEATEGPMSSATLGIAVGDAPQEVEDANAETLRAVYEAYNQQNLDAFDDLYAERYTGHEPGRTTEGPEALKATLNAFRSAFPDSEFTIEQLFTQGEYVASRVTFHGAFENPLVTGEGDQSIPPTGQPVTLTFNAIHRFDENGRIVEAWEAYDRISLLAQLGALPGMTATDETSG